MDTEEYIAYSKEIEEIIDKISYLEGDLEELAFVIEYVELTRCLQEIYQWYQILRFNLKKLKNELILGDVIAVNTYMIGLLSAGKCFIDIIKMCMKNCYGEDSDEYKIFIKDYIEGEYDNCFSYRFLTRLRNFSQHCHIPVSYQNNLLSFDLVQIYNTPHYNFNKKLEAEVKLIMEDIRINDNEMIKLAIEPTVSSYICSVYKIFKFFLNCISKGLNSIHTNILNTIKENPELINHTEKKEYEGMLFYRIVDSYEILHAVDITEDPLKLRTLWFNDVVEAYKEEVAFVKKWKNDNKKSVPHNNSQR